jgi:hypothetical protein
MKKGREVLMKKICLFSILIFILSALTFGVETVLQNGIGDYEGCEDTYLSDKDGQNTAFGGADMLSLQGYH